MHHFRYTTTWSWPIITLRGWVSAAAFMAWGGEHHLATEWGMVLSGAIYGMSTGPLLAILLDDDQSAVLSLILREDLS